ncbi:MAG: hypothetical protein IT371_17580 [Deltaproteobacteria bacterium]|nr:hypothetical protein [Deltaproteobacteria bacterium]
MTMRLFLVALLGVGAYGGYYGYCRYELHEREARFSVEATDLRQALMRMNKVIRPADVRQAVTQMAAKAQVTVVDPDLVVRIDPMTPETLVRLPSIAQAALGMTARIPGHRGPRWVIGFRARLTAKHGVAKHAFDAERCTWFDDAAP